VPDMLKEKISGFIDKIRSIDGIVACALVSRDGIVAGEYIDRSISTAISMNHGRELSSQLSCQLLSRLEALSG
jgi:hypothetical protein